MSSNEKASRNILVCATGSVAAIKIPEIILGIKKELHGNCTIRFIPTDKALHFLPELNGPDAEKQFGIEIFQDHDEWSSWNKRGDPVIHIELRKWADLLVIGNNTKRSIFGSK